MVNRRRVRGLTVRPRTSVRGSRRLLTALFTQAYRPTVLRGIHHVKRGYRRPLGQFAALGLTIRPGLGRGGGELSSCGWRVRA